MQKGVKLVSIVSSCMQFRLAINNNIMGMWWCHHYDVKQGASHDCTHPYHQSATAILPHSYISSAGVDHKYSHVSSRQADTKHNGFTKGASGTHRQYSSTWENDTSVTSLVSRPYRRLWGTLLTSSEMFVLGVVYLFVYLFVCLSKHDSRKKQIIVTT